MADGPASSSSRPVSGIPMPTNKRSSLSYNSAMPPTGSSPTPASRASSPVVLSAPPAGKAGLGASARRKSSLNTSTQSGSWKVSLQDLDTDDPDVLKAHIHQLNSMLVSSYQNSASHLADAGFASSALNSPQPHTPMTERLDLPSYEISTPLSDIDRLSDAQGSRSPNVDVNGGSLLDGPNHGKNLLPRLPHSTSSYDLKSSAMTPGKGVVRKISDGPLGLSRIPQSAVTQALALHASSPSDSPISAKRNTRSRTTSPTPPQDPSQLRSPFLGSDFPSPSLATDNRYSPIPRKVSAGGSAASTRVIDGLQTDLLNARGHNDKLKQEIRANQRLIGSLTRQNEDLKETKERMRVECEGLNNVIARKERLLQEVLERARTAESSLAQHLSTKKALEQSTKKSLQQMSSQLTDAQAAQSKAESESSSLRESVKSLKGVWARDLKAAREEIKKADEKGRRDLIEARESHLQLVKLVESQAVERASVQALAEKAVKESEDLTELFRSQIAELRVQAEKSEEASTQAQTTAVELATELAHLRRLMREPRRASLDNIAQALTVETDHDNEQ